MRTQLILISLGDVSNKFIGHARNALGGVFGIGNHGQHLAGFQFFIDAAFTNNNPANQTFLIVACVDGKVWLIAEPINPHAQNTNTERVKGANRHFFPCLFADHVTDTLQHFIRRLIGKRDCKNLRRRNPFLHHMRDPTRHRARLARASTRKNQNGAVE